MNDFMAESVHLKNAVQALSNIATSFVNITRQTGSEMMRSLSNISASNMETIRADSKLVVSALLSPTINKIKQYMKEVIEHAGRTLSDTAKSTIEHAKNATSTVFNEALEKMHYEIDLIVDDLITNQIVIAIGIFLLIILLLIFGYVFVHIHITLSCGAQRVKLMIQMILILVYPLLCMFYVLTRKSLVEIAIQKRICSVLSGFVSY
jgi:hypothetical protein